MRYLFLFALVVLVGVVGVGSIGAQILVGPAFPQPPMKGIYAWYTGDDIVRQGIAHGSTIQTWHDISGALSCGGAACDLTQATSGNRPYANLTLTNSGRPGVYFPSNGLGSFHASALNFPATFLHNVNTTVALIVEWGIHDPSQRTSVLNFFPGGVDGGIFGNWNIVDGQNLRNRQSMAVKAAAWTEFTSTTATTTGGTVNLGQVPSGPVALMILDQAGGSTCAATAGCATVSFGGATTILGLGSSPRLASLAGGYLGSTISSGNGQSFDATVLDMLFWDHTLNGTEQAQFNTYARTRYHAYGFRGGATIADNVVCIGDSITGSYQTSYGQGWCNGLQNSLQGVARVQNLGLTGYDYAALTNTGTIPSWNTYRDPNAAKNIAIVNFGYNDINNVTTASQAYTNMTNFVAMLKGATNTVQLVNVASGLTATGTGTCLLTLTGGGSPSVAATVTANVVSGVVAAPTVVTNPGLGYTSAPTGASVITGTAGSCGGTPVLRSYLGAGFDKVLVWGLTYRAGSYPSGGCTAANASTFDTYSASLRSGMAGADAYFDVTTLSGSPFAPSPAGCSTTATCSTTCNLSFFASADHPNNAGAALIGAGILAQLRPLL